MTRVATDLPYLREGTLPPQDDFARRYVESPVPAYLHVVSGAIVVGAPFQLSRRFRDSNLARHRRLGRIVLGAGVVTGAMGVVVGLVMPFGDLAEATASLVFGVYFPVALGRALFLVRSGDTTSHRRWMIRAFALGVAVGLIRIVVGVGEALGTPIAESFGAAFWIALVAMSVLAEIWLWARPSLKGRRVAAAPR